MLGLLSSCIFFSSEKYDGALNEKKIIYVNANIIIDSADELVIRQGTEYIFEDTFKIIVQGVLKVEGQKNNPVVFRPADSLKFWGGIEFDFPSGPSSIDYAEFKNGRVIGNKVDLEISNSKFCNNLSLNVFDAVIRVFGGSIIVSNCIFTGNDTGEGILVHELANSPAIVKDCEFYGVSDAIEFLHVKNKGKIVNNKIFNIGQETGDGIDFNGCDSILIEGNAFVNIRDYGCEIGNDKYGPSKRIRIRDNIFVNCYRGIVAKGGSEIFSENNIFYENIVGIECQIETWAKNTDPNTLFVDNSIFCNSKVEDYMNNENSTILITNSYSDRQILGKTNHQQKIQFNDPQNLDFNIIGESAFNLKSDERDLKIICKQNGKSIIKYMRK